MARPAFPLTLREFRQKFSSEEACWEYLRQSRWTDGFRCPYCNSTQGWWIAKRRIQECRSCGRQTSILSGTALHGSHLPIQEWFWAAYLVATHTPGISAKQLERQLGCHYRTAWFLLHRLRRAMVNDSRSLLKGKIEADETIIGGPVRGIRGRGVVQAEHNTLVLGAVEVLSYKDQRGQNAEKAGRLRLAIAKHADENSIRKFLHANVELESQIDTDGWRGYSKTALSKYKHVPHRAETHALHIHRAFGNLKTWLNETHHGVDPKYLQNYLDEFVFRFNRRQTPMAAFQTLLGIASSKNPRAC